MKFKGSILLCAATVAFPLALMAGPKGRYDQVTSCPNVTDCLTEQAGPFLQNDGLGKDNITPGKACEYTLQNKQHVPCDNPAGYQTKANAPE